MKQIKAADSFLEGESNMGILKFIRDILPGEFIDHSRIVAVEQLRGGVVLQLEGGKQRYLQGNSSMVEVEQHVSLSQSEKTAIQKQLADEYYERSGGGEITYD